MVADNAGDDPAAAVHGDAEDEVGRLGHLLQLRVVQRDAIDLPELTSGDDSPRRWIPRHPLGVVEAVDEHRRTTGARKVLQRVDTHWPTFGSTLTASPPI